MDPCWHHHHQRSASSAEIHGVVSIHHATVAGGDLVSGFSLVSMPGSPWVIIIIIFITVTIITITIIIMTLIFFFYFFFIFFFSSLFSFFDRYVMKLLLPPGLQA